MTRAARVTLTAVTLAPFIPSEDESDFSEQVITVLPKYYDDVDSSFGRSILESHKLGYDPVGHFTKRKVIFRVLIDRTRIGYTVVTEKRGGSVKIGPTFLYPEWRGKGIGTYIRTLLQQRYKSQGARKAYSTVADNKIDSYRYLVKSGYSVEAHLREHYSQNHGELIFGQMLDTPAFDLLRPPILQASVGCAVYPSTRERRSDVRDYILKGMLDSFDEIDETFVSDLFKAEDRGQDRFEYKGKTVFVAANADQVCGVAVTTAKRGGAVKVAPLLASGYNVFTELIDALRNHYSRLDNRKIYVVAPFHHLEMAHALSRIGFRCEGLLREPYKKGVDMKIISAPLQVANFRGERHSANEHENNMTSAKVGPKLNAVLSILPDPVNRILQGNKSFELRKFIPDRPLRGMYLYATGNVQAFCAYIEVLGYYHLPKERLWNVVGEMACSRQRFEEYFRKWSSGYGIAISRVFKFSKPIPNRQARLVDSSFRVPMQYFYLDEDGDLGRLLESERSRSTMFDTGIESVISAHSGFVSWR